jgi:2-polyprenyl-6-hydroxyphenyl methylase/3-demethylubiquinone-9 3-methyltransferase
VACARELKHRYFPRDKQWTIEQGSVLDRPYLSSQGEFDVVYSWGVLHHTGAMWQALDNVLLPLAPTGALCISIYNDQGRASRRWRAIKRLYNRSPGGLRFALVLAVGTYFESRGALIRLVRLQNPLPFADWAEKKKTRGMSVWYDLVDWVGGYPFEVAKPEQIFAFYRQRGYQLVRLTTQGGGHGCNEFVFVRDPEAHSHIAHLDGLA